MGSREIAISTFPDEYKAKRVAEKAVNYYARRFMENEYRHVYEEAYKEAAGARPTLSALIETEAPRSGEMKEYALPIPATIGDCDHLTLEQAAAKPESLESEDIDEDVLPVPVAIEDGDRLTVEQADCLIDNLESLGDLGDGEKGASVELKKEMVDTALDVVKSKSCKLHHVFREELGGMVGRLAECRRCWQASPQRPSCIRTCTRH